MMSFAHEAIWTSIITTAIKESNIGLSPYRADVPLSGPIPDDIMEGIFNARIILVDLSPQLLTDGKTEDGREMRYLYNWNVAYELGIAHIVRQKEEVILISQTIEKMPFDIQHWHIHKYDPNDIKDSVNRITNLLKNADMSIDHSRSLLVKRDSKKLESYCFSILVSAASKGRDGFIEDDLKTADGGKTTLDPNFAKMAIYHMLELNIIETNYLPNKQYNYIITDKGKAIIQYVKSKMQIVI